MRRILLLLFYNFLIKKNITNIHGIPSIFLCDTNINVENVVKYLCDVFSTNNYKKIKYEVILNKMCYNRLRKRMHTMFPFCFQITRNK